MEFGRCKFCGADNVKSPKTQKIFCSEKCWLKGQENQQQIKYSPVDKPDWEKIREEKAIGLAKGAAFNKSVDVVIAGYNKGEIQFVDIPDFVQRVFNKFKEINIGDETME